MITRERDITERTFHFAIRVVRMVGAIPRSTCSDVLARQLMRSGTSVGANVEEAQAASSKKEFCRRMEIAQSEAREALYWLRLAAESGVITKTRLSALIKEADELVRILTSIAKHSRGR